MFLFRLMRRGVIVLKVPMLYNLCMAPIFRAVFAMRLVAILPGFGLESSFMWGFGILSISIKWWNISQAAKIFARVAQISGVVIGVGYSEEIFRKYAANLTPPIRLNCGDIDIIFPIEVAIRRCILVGSFEGGQIATLFFSWGDVMELNFYVG